MLKKSQSRPELVRTVSYPRKAHGALPPRKEKTGSQFGKYIGLFFVIGFGAFMLLTGGIQSENKAAESQPEEEIVMPKIPESLDYTEMSAAIESVIADYPSMDIGVAWIDIKTSDAGSYGVQDPFVAASTAKLFTAIAFLHDVEEGTNSFDDRVAGRSAKDALEAMIVKSDNQAWKDFNNSVMSHEELAAYADNIGFSEYDPTENTITPTSLARLINNLFERRLLNDENTRLLLGLMQRAYEPTVQFIPDLAPEGVTVYHKPGYLNDRVHDAAIIDNGSRPYVLVIFTKARGGSYNPDAGKDVFTRITNATLKTFTGQ